MEKNKSYFIIGLLCIIIVLLLLYTCNRKNIVREEVVITKTTIDTVYDTVPVIIHSKPKLVEVIRVDSFEIPTIIDTNAILSDYFSKYIYSDTVEEDTNFRAIILDTISKNEILSRVITFTNLRPTKIITNETTIYRINNHKLFVGGGVSYRLRNDPDIAIHIELDYVNKDINRYGIYISSSSYVGINYSRLLFKR